MDVEKDFDVWLLTVEVFTDNYDYEPFQRAAYGTWVPLTSMSGWRLGLFKHNIIHDGKVLPSFVYPRDPYSVVMITKIDLATLKSFHGSSGSYTFDPEKMQPFLFGHYQDQFKKFESIFDNEHINWLGYRPIAVYMEPKPGIVFPMFEMEKVLELLEPYIHFYTAHDQHFGYFYVGAPNVTKADEQGSRIFVMNHYINSNHRKNEEGFHCLSLLLEYLDFVIDYNRLRLISAKWKRFQFPDFDDLEIQKIKKNRLTYADQLHEDLRCLIHRI